MLRGKNDIFYVYKWRYLVYSEIFISISYLRRSADAVYTRNLLSVILWKLKDRSLIFNRVKTKNLTDKRII